MILVDTSAWVEFLRDTGSPACVEVERQLDADLAVTDAVLMEVLAGAGVEGQLRQLRSLMGRTTLLPTTGADFTAAASLFRTCRSRGETVRRLWDCLIAATAIRSGVAVLHADRDFGALARCAPLEVHPLPR